MDFIEFLGRHLISSVLGAAGLILLALGYADQAANIWAAALPWQLQGVGAALFTVAVILILFRWDQRYLHSRSDTHSVDPPNVKKPIDDGSLAKPVVPKDEEAENSAPLPVFASMPKLPAGEVLVSDAVTGRFLRNLCDGKTTHQQSLIGRPYVGKWIRLSGKVRDVSPLDSQGWIVSLVEPDREMPESTHIQFQEDQTPRLEILSAGDQISALGKIASFDKFLVRLNDGILI